MIDKMQHTPGPWYVGNGEWDQSRHIYATQTVSNGQDTWHPLIAVTDDDETLIDHEANARLIAAAPDLLNALRKIVMAIDGYGCISEKSDYDLEARAAIAKATGEEG